MRKLTSLFACTGIMLAVQSVPGATFAATYKDAPALAAKAAAGQLPAVDQRLPADPLVVKPLESVGRYGGTWRQAMIGGSDSLIERTIGYSRLVRWNPEWTEVVPDVAEKVDANPDGTTYTFTLRKGMKWSDGEPFTADDILFWYNDILMNKEITPAVPAWLRAGGKPVVVTKTDDEHVVFTFAAPNGLFLEKLAGLEGADILDAAPAHYLKRFIKKDNPDGIDKLVADSGAPNWVALIQRKIGFPDRWRDADRPVLDPWKLSVPYVGSRQVVAERNPYYYKVDTAGNQLPYLDRVTFDMMGDQQSLILKAANGELDMQSLHLGSVEAQRVIAQNQKRSGYHLFKARPAWSNAMLICLNETAKDKALRQVFSSKDFRIGLSLAINRDELNDIIYAGQAQPYQAAPLPDTKLYDEQMANQYLKYDPEAANAALDKAGFTQKDSGGFRLGPDGKRISFAVMATTDHKEQIDALELVKKYWAAVGVDMNVQPVEQSLAFARLAANDEQAIVWIGGGGYDLLGLLDPKWYFPHEYQSSFASAWGIYYQNPKDPNAEEPSAPAKEQQALYRKLQDTPSLDGQIALMKQILAITRDQFYVIGTNMAPPNYGVVNNKLHNVPAVIPDTLFYMTPGPTDPEQYYLDQ